MAIIKPFRGLRPKADLASQIASPPYDVINSEEARVMAQGNDLSFLHVVKSEIDLDPETNQYDTRVYEKAADNFKKFVEHGMFLQDEQDCFYLYQQIMGGHKQVGIIACVSADDYQNNIIKKHELTRPDKEEDRTKHIDLLDAQTGMVFLTYRARESVDAAVNECVKRNPAYDFTSPDGVQHIIWVVDDPEKINIFKESFHQVSAIYIADGHHRSASSVRVRDRRKAKNPQHNGEEEYNYFLGVLVPHNQVQILSYNRVVKDLNQYTKTQFLEKLAEKFEVVPSKDNQPYAPDQPHSFGMYLDSCWYCLKAKKGIYRDHDPIESLDVHILQEGILSPLLDIKNPRTDERIDFIGGIRGLKELEKRVDEGAYQVAFSLYPTTVENLMEVADSNQVMPPKSTWFEPKLRSGLIVHLLS